MKIIGISLNSRSLSIAILEGLILHDYKVYLFKEQWSKQKAKRILECLWTCLNEHNVTNLALALPYVYYTNVQTSSLIEQIKVTCRQKNISLSTYLPQTLNCFCTPARAKKKTLMAAMTEYYPELAYPYQKELRNKNKYYYKLFEAVAAATLLANELALIH